MYPVFERKGLSLNVIVLNLCGSTNCTRELAHLLSPWIWVTHWRKILKLISVDRVLHGMMQYIEKQFQLQMKPRVKRTHRHHRALLLLMLGSAAIISSLRGCLSMAKTHASQSDFNDSILYHQFAVSHDITKEWIQPCTTGWEAMFCRKISNRSSRFSISSPNNDKVKS